MWEEFCALVLRSVHFNYSAWNLATRVVLWVYEANCPMFSSESRLLSMPGEGQHLHKRVLTKTSTIFLNKKDTLRITNFSWSSFLRWDSPSWRLEQSRGDACSRAKKHPPSLSQHSSNTISYLKKLSSSIAICLWTVMLVRLYCCLYHLELQCQRIKVFLVSRQPALLRDVQRWSE